jgi:hypothetical protein
MAGVQRSRTIFARTGPETTEECVARYMGWTPGGAAYRYILTSMIMTSTLFVHSVPRPSWLADVALYCAAACEIFPVFWAIAILVREKHKG